MPYERGDAAERYRPMSARRLREVAPHAYTWLDGNQTLLRERAEAVGIGPWNDQNWVQYSARKNLERFEDTKVLVPYMVKELCAVADAEHHYFVNVTTGGYGVALSADYDISADYLAALLNSELLSWALKRFGRAWRGSYIGARKGNLARLPIDVPPPNTQHEIATACERCRRAAAALQDARSEHDMETLARIYDQSVAAFDAMVFELYGIDHQELRIIRSA